MVHATEYFEGPIDVLPPGALDLPELSPGWEDATPPESPRPSSPLSSDGEFPGAALDLDAHAFGSHPVPSAPTKHNSPVMWSAGDDSPACELPVRKLAGLVPSWEDLDLGSLAKTLSSDGLRSSEHSILSMELFTTKRKATEEEELEARKAKARRTRDTSLSPDFPQDTPEARRATHNVLERKRRHDLKTCYADLRGCIPTLVGSERASTAVILQRAVEYIESLKKMDQDFVAAKAALEAENQALRARLQ